MRALSIAQRLPRLWYKPSLAAALIPLLPVSWLFHLLVRLRQTAYHYGAIRSQRLPVPVIVIGNLTVGGSGKTPLVLWLIKHLREAGKRPGIISRGYGGKADGVQCVSANSTSAIAGDEPLLLARRSGAPVFIGRDRVAAGQALLAAHPDCDVIVSDDGLQHYRLQRSVEIAVFDARGAGNSRLLPAGPLREPLLRLSTTSAVVWNIADDSQKTIIGTPANVPQFTMHLAGSRFFSLTDATKRCSAIDLQGKRLFAIAGIGDPSRFFVQLESLGLTFEAHPFPDHHGYGTDDLSFASSGVLLMTEKDAVKCAAIVTCEAWVLPVDAHLDRNPEGNALLDIILEKLNGPSPA